MLSPQEQEETDAMAVDEEEQGHCEWMRSRIESGMMRDAGGYGQIVIGLDLMGEANRNRNCVVARERAEK